MVAWYWLLICAFVFFWFGFFLCACMVAVKEIDSEKEIYRKEIASLVVDETGDKEKGLKETGRWHHNEPWIRPDETPDLKKKI